MTQGYAYEIRFVDDNKVQVFDLARRHVDPTSSTLPTEYKAEEVLRGDLRYSKLLGTQQNDTEEQWEHVTYTKRGRRSIQRHTFMMGSHSTEHDTVMDLEVGNKCRQDKRISITGKTNFEDIADIRFNENNIYQNISNNNVSATDKNSLNFSIQSTSLDSSVAETIENSPDRNQSMHFEIEEADMANVLKKPPSSMHENNTQSAASQTLHGDVTSDQHLKGAIQNHYVKRQNQDHPIESGYSINKQQEKMNLSSSWKKKEDTLNGNNNQMDNGDLKKNSFEYKIDGATMKSSTQYKNNHASKSDREPNNSKMSIQVQQLDHENAYQKEQHRNIRHQMDQQLSNIETKNSRNSHANTTSDEKASCYSTNTPMGYSNGHDTLTRVKSVSLENYEASPERSCCIIS